MNKGDLVKEVAKVLKTKKDAQAAVDCVFSSITNALGNGDSVSLVLGQVAFTGDALFAGSIGGTSSEAANQRERANIRAELFSLPETTELYPGHGPATTVWIEKNHNPFFV